VWRWDRREPGLDGATIFFARAEVQHFHQVPLININMSAEGRGARSQRDGRPLKHRRSASTYEIARSRRSIPRAPMTCRKVRPWTCSIRQKNRWPPPAQPRKGDNVWMVSADAAGTYPLETSPRIWSSALSSAGSILDGDRALELLIAALRQSPMPPPRSFFWMT